MSQNLLIFNIILPIAAGVIQLACRHHMTTAGVHRFTMMITVLTSIFAWAMILTCGEEPVVLLHFTDRLAFTLAFDGTGRWFAGIVATLWPLTTLYAYEYMEKIGREAAFFSFFMMAYGVTLGIAMAGDLFTLYCFYELLTLTTAPLVMHTMTRDAVRAAKTYFTFSLGGAAFAFVSMVYAIMCGGEPARSDITTLFYILGFFGFGVKAAVFPLYIWLPRASVAPTPVTALLHAVAVVKAGVFAIIRLTYFTYGTKALSGTVAQYLPMAFAVFTIFFGAAMAVRETHWKRRLAYSTVANLSYILFGVLLMTPEGLTGGLLHMAFHAEIKILAFFAAGAVLVHTGREYIWELDGLGRKMPVTFGCFTVAALALTGVPPLSGFVSKWYLLKAAASAGTWQAYTGAAVILVGALLTAFYMLTVVRRAFLPDKNAEPAAQGEIHEAGWRMLVPMIILAAGIIVTGVGAAPIVRAAETVASATGIWF